MTLNPITSRVLGSIKHGFFTRIGGSSKSVFSELNCGFGSPENRDIVAHNRSLIADHIGVAREYLYTVTQVHSARVITIDKCNGFDPNIEADALVTNIRGVALGVLTADCAPILFHDAINMVSGAAHAGWRGAISGISGATVDQMCMLGADRKHIRAAVGPCISQKNYEVGKEFINEFVSRKPESSRFFKNKKDNKYQFDLPSFILHQLSKLDIGEVEWTGHCTYAEPEKFYSYRYFQHNNLPSYGRHLSVITN